MNEARVEAFIDELVTLEIDPASLPLDPSGETWLPSHLREIAREDPECARELAEFVEMERALCEVHEPCDAFFTRKVMDRLPEIEAVDDRRRTWILASAYALAIGVAYLGWGPLLASGEIAAWIEPLRAWVDAQAAGAGAAGLWVAVGLMCAACALVLFPTDRRVRA